MDVMKEVAAAIANERSMSIKLLMLVLLDYPVPIEPRNIIDEMFPDATPDQKIELLDKMLNTSRDANDNGWLVRFMNTLMPDQVRPFFAWISKKMDEKIESIKGK